MKKNIIITILIFFSASTFGASNEQFFKSTFKGKLYYSSYLFMKNAVLDKMSTPASIKKKQGYKVLSTVHPAIYIKDKDLDRLKSVSTIMDYAVGVRSFFQKDFSTARTKLLSIKKSSLLYSESRYLLGMLDISNKDASAGTKNFYACYIHSKKLRGSHSEILKNHCLQMMGRGYFHQKKFKKALFVLNKIKVDEYVWPKTLFDRAWTHYYLGHKARALGIVTSLSSPILQRFMLPEINYFKGLIYYENCQYDKFNKVYSEFNSKLFKNRQLIRKISSKKILKSLKKNKPPKSSIENDLYYILKGYKKDIKYLNYKKAWKYIKAERKKIARIGKTPLAKRLMKNLKSSAKIIERDIIQFVDKVKGDYYQQILMTQRHFVKLKLLVSLDSRKILRGEKEKNKTDGRRMELNEISSTEGKYIWEFQGGFWADEIGSYAVALENLCEKVK